MNNGRIKALDIECFVNGGCTLDDSELVCPSPIQPCDTGFLDVSFWGYFPLVLPEYQKLFHFVLDIQREENVQRKEKIQWLGSLSLCGRSSITGPQELPGQPWEFLAVQDPGSVASSGPCIEPETMPTRAPQPLNTTWEATPFPTQKYCSVYANLFYCS